MECVFDELEEPKDGARRVLCIACGRISPHPIAVTSPLWKIHRDCTGVLMPRPGDELALLLAQLNITKTAGCGCADKAHQMNLWGVERCRENRAEIIDWLNTAATERGWLASVAAHITAGWLVDLAIENAEKRCAQLRMRPRTAQSVPPIV